MPRTLRTLLLIVVLALVLHSVRAWLPFPTPGGLKAGEEAPAFRLPVLGGGEISSRSFRGKATVLVFWATWCGPCRREIPTLQALSEAGEQVVSISIDEQEEVLAPFVTKRALSYPVLLGSRDLLQSFGARGIPYTVVIDGEGRVVASYLGTVGRRVLSKALARAEA